MLEIIEHLFFETILNGCFFRFDHLHLNKYKEQIIQVSPLRRIFQNMDFPYSGMTHIFPSKGKIGPENLVQSTVFNIFTNNFQIIEYYVKLTKMKNRIRVNRILNL